MKELDENNAQYQIALRIFGIPLRRSTIKEIHKETGMLIDTAVAQSDLNCMSR